MRQSVRWALMERREIITKLFGTLLGERPGGPRDAVRGNKRSGEADRVLPASHKSAEPEKAGNAGTSAPASGPARESAMERETESMSDASSTCSLADAEVGGTAARLRGVLAPCWSARVGGERRAARQPLGEPAGLEGRIPHGVKSAPTADKRLQAEPKNLVVASKPPGDRRVAMIEARDDRGDEGRSLRSSAGTGKPFTWRREAVGTAGKQEVDACPAR